jgi:hypothetical protein
MNMQLLLGLWAAVIVAYMSVLVMRWIVGKREDDHLHVLDSEQTLVSQSAIAHKLDVLDRWKATLLILTVLVGIIIGTLHVYNTWQATSTIPQVR